MFFCCYDNRTARLLKLCSLEMNPYTVRHSHINNVTKLSPVLNGFSYFSCSHNSSHQKETSSNNVKHGTSNGFYFHNVCAKEAFKLIIIDYLK